MISRNKANQIANSFEDHVFSRVSDIFTMIEAYSLMGAFDMEVFIEKKLVTKATSTLTKKGYYGRVGVVNSVEKWAILYVDWSGPSAKTIKKAKKTISKAD